MKNLQHKNIPSNYVLSYNSLPINKSATYHIIDQHSRLAGVHKIKNTRTNTLSRLVTYLNGRKCPCVCDRLGYEDLNDIRHIRPPLP